MYIGGIMGGVEIYSVVVLDVNFEVAEGYLGDNPGRSEGYLSKKIWVLRWKVF